MAKTIPTEVPLTQLCKATKFLTLLFPGSSIWSQSLGMTHIRSMLLKESGEQLKLWAEDLTQITERKSRYWPVRSRSRIIGFGNQSTTIWWSSMTKYIPFSHYSQLIHGVYNPPPGRECDERKGECQVRNLASVYCSFTQQAQCRDHVFYAPR